MVFSFTPCDWCLSSPESPIWLGMNGNTTIQQVDSLWTNRDSNEYVSTLHHLSSFSFDSMNWDCIEQFILFLFYYCYFMFMFLEFPFLSGMELVLLTVWLSDCSTIWWECTSGRILHKEGIEIATACSRFASMNKCDRRVWILVRILEESVFGDICWFERIV